MPFDRCAEYLAQGDIFSLKIVAPYADHVVRIFRSDSGLHGSLVFEENGPGGKVYDLNDLEQTLEGLPAERKTMPFQDQEMVVVYADLLEYFVLASQTCDVSGVDSTPKSFVAIVPFITLGSYFSYMKLPIGLSQEESQDRSLWSSMVDFLARTNKCNLDQFRDDPFILPTKIREFVKEWDPPKNSKDREIRNKLKDIIKNVPDPKKRYLYYLPPSGSFGVPEGFVDFCRLYSLKIEVVQDLKNKRVATIKTPYREQFAEKLSHYLARIATPFNFKPPEL